MLATIWRMRPVALNVVVMPELAVTFAVSVLAPAAGPSVQLNRRATPFASVVTGPVGACEAPDVVLMVPAPLAMFHVTEMPGARFPCASFTTAPGGTATSVPRNANWLFELGTSTAGAIEAGGPTVPVALMM